MKIITDKANLLGSLARAKRAISSGAVKANNSPILSHVLLQVQGSRLRMSGTDHSLYITSWFNGEIDEPGGVALPADLFNGIVAQLDQDLVTIEVNDKTFSTKIRVDGWEGTLRGLDPAQSPRFPEIRQEGVVVDARLLKRALERVLVAAPQGAAGTGDQTTKPALFTVQFMLDEGRLGVMCAQTGWLAHDSLPLDEETVAPGMSVFNIGVKAVTELVKAITDEPGLKVRFCFDSGHVAMRYANVEIITFPVNDHLTDKRATFEQEAAASTTWLEFDRAAIASPLELARLYTDQEMKGAKDGTAVPYVTLEIEPAKTPDGTGELRVRSQAKMVGGAADGVISVKAEGEALTVSVAPSQFRTFLQTLMTERVRLGFSGPAGKIFMRSTEPGDPHRIFMMPRRLYS